MSTFAKTVFFKFKTFSLSFDFCNCKGMNLKENGIKPMKNKWNTKCISNKYTTEHLEKKTLKRDKSIRST